MISSFMAGVGGVILASRLRSVDTNTGGGNLLLNAIAAAVIGGTSLFGGSGSVMSAFLGALITDQNLFAAELQLAEMRGTEFTAMVNLYRALGGGWQIAEQPATKP